MNIELVRKCQCGAVTVYFEGKVNNSMPLKLFRQHFPGVVVPRSPVYGNCNYCVNHWGIDLCACGSGEKVHKCKEGFENCGTPAQELFTEKTYELWR